ncbi:MAG TPA: sigma-70 family RNA polymerase sigma factor [Candidatus Angelobacter sp.]|nr:sigma-70 family RNA polymerase sigma factor [Candidatus Angelobacter sp.]
MREPATLVGPAKTRFKALKARPMVYRFPVIAQSPNRQSAATAAVYWGSTATVELYPFNQDYLLRLRARSAETEAHFVEYFNTLLKAKLRSDGYSEAPLSDIRQETLYRVLKAIYLDKIQNPQSLRSFVYGVCERVEWEYDRGEWRQGRDENDEFPNITDERTTADGPARQAELLQTVRWVLERLPEKDRKILIALFMDEKERDEICREFGITRDNLRVLLHRALASARKLLSKGAAS